MDFIPGMTAVHELQVMGSIVYILKELSLSNTMELQTSMLWKLRPGGTPVPEFQAV
jgi:hypothetical protein